MKSLSTRAFWLAAALLLGQTAQAAGPDAAMIEAARKEGQVVWYSTLIVNQILRPMVAAFEAKYPGVEVRYSRQTNSDVALKILNEARARRPQADIFDGTNSIYPVQDAGLLAAYPPAAAIAFSGLAAWRSRSPRSERARPAAPAPDRFRPVGALPPLSGCRRATASPARSRPRP